MDSEKKFKLDELSDHKSESSPKPTSKPSPSRKKAEVDPRIESIKKLSSESRVEQMQRKWVFDKPVRLWGWSFYLVLLLILEKSGLHQHYVSDIDILNRESMEMGGTMLTSIFMGGDFIVKHPLFLGLLTPVFFKFKKPSLNLFEVNFDGINTVKKISDNEGELPARVMIKWNDITAVSRIELNEKPVLVLSSNAGPLGQLIWDLKEENQQAFKLLLRGLIPRTHALSQYLEKETT